jgi:hypothetical protein
MGWNPFKRSKAPIQEQFNIGNYDPSTDTALQDTFKANNYNMSQNWLTGQNDIADAMQARRIGGSGIQFGLLGNLYRKLQGDTTAANQSSEMSAYEMWLKKQQMQADLVAQRNQDALQQWQAGIQNKNSLVGGILGLGGSMIASGKW